MMSNDAKPADSESDIDTDSLSDTVGKQPALAEKIEGATKDSLATNSDQLPEDTTSANGEDEKPKLAMLPPPVRKARPPVPAFSSQSGAAAQKPPGEEAQRTDEGRTQSCTDYPHEKAGGTGNSPELYIFQNAFSTGGWGTSTAQQPLSS
jgi:hypothetical protein